MAQALIVISYDIQDAQRPEFRGADYLWTGFG
jgi:hypothetical protein